MKTFLSFLRWLVLGGVTLVISACYGPPMEFKTKKLRTVDSASTPIKDLSVTFTNVPTKDSISDSEGAVYYEYDIQYSHEATAQITDTDGALNGGDFASQSVTLDGSDLTTVIMTLKP